MEIIEKLCYGVEENTNKDLLYVKKITLSNYKEPRKVKTFMELLQLFKIYQYNYDDSKTSDYFFWQFVDDKGEENWQSVDLCCYQNNMESIFKMYKLKEICETTYTDIQATIYYDNIDNLVRKIREEEREIPLF